MGFLYRYSTSEAFILTVAYSCWEILQEKWTILAFPTGFKYHCSGTWTQWCMRLPGRRQQLPDRFTISNLKLHYLFRQDFLASNHAFFFAYSIDKTKDSGILDGPQSMPCDPWWWQGSAKLDGDVSRCKQVPADAPQAWELELQALLHIAFLVALFKSSLWAILKCPSARYSVMRLMLLYSSLATAARQLFLAFKSNMIISYSQISPLCIGPLLSVFRPSGASSCRSLLSPWCFPGWGWLSLKPSPTSVWIHHLRETSLMKYI